MALYNSGIVINKTSESKPFLPTKLFSYNNGDLFFANKLKIIPIPLLPLKIILDHQHRDSINIVVNTSVEFPKVPSLLTTNKLLTLANLLGEFSQKVEIYLGTDGDVMFVVKTNNALLKFDTLESSAIDLTEDNIISIMKTKDGEEYFFLLNNSKHCFYLSKSILYKALYDNMICWFDNLYPGAIVANDSLNSIRLTQSGMKMLTSFYLDSLGVLESVFYLSEFPDDLVLSVSKNSLEILGKSEKKLTNILKIKLPDELIGNIVAKEYPEISSSTGYVYPMCTGLVPGSKIKIPGDLKVTWTCFTRHREQFTEGCVIILAKNEVVLDENNKKILDYNDIEKIVFRGNECSDISKQNSVEIFMKEELSNEAVHNIKEYFDKVKISIYCVKLIVGKTGTEVGDTDEDIIGWMSATNSQHRTDIVEL